MIIYSFVLRLSVVIIGWKGILSPILMMNISKKLLFLLFQLMHTFIHFKNTNSH